MKAVLIIAMSLLLLPGCAARTQQAHGQAQKKMAPFQTGKTTYTEVLAQLGEPTDSIRHPDGSRSISYFTSRSQAKVDSSVPFFGGFREGSEVESSFVSMRFNKAGLLVHYSAVVGKTLTGASTVSELQP